LNSADLEKKLAKSVQLVRVSFFRSDFLQNPYLLSGRRVKENWAIFQIFVCFSDYLNFRGMYEIEYNIYLGTFKKCLYFFQNVEQVLLKTPQLVQIARGLNILHSWINHVSFHSLLRVKLITLALTTTVILLDISHGAQLVLTKTICTIKEGLKLMELQRNSGESVMTLTNALFHQSVSYL
jgi:hypothetical protein